MLLPENANQDLPAPDMFQDAEMLQESSDHFAGWRYYRLLCNI
jgi:hypothetical protein